MNFFVSRIVVIILVTILALFSRANSESAADEASMVDLKMVQQRYRQWVLDGPGVNYGDRHVAQRYRTIMRHAGESSRRLNRIIESDPPIDLYDTRRTGSDQRELEFLIKYALPHLAIAYQLPGPSDDPNPFYQDEQILQLVMAAFDRLHVRGFRQGMLMPWKTREVENEVDNKAIVVDFHLRTAGYALATFLVRHELAASGRLERTLQTCRDVLSHGEKFGDPGMLKQNADGVRMVVNFALPYALAAEDRTRLNLVVRQIERSMVMESNAGDTIKPDGLGFHHLGVYMSGYSAFAVAQSAFMAWLFDGTDQECSPGTVANISEAMAVLRVVSHKYDMHKSLAGRLREIKVIPSVMMGYGYLAAFEHPRRDEFRGILVRLCDDQFLDSANAERAFSAHRNEVPPGPGAIDAFQRTLAEASEFGAESDPAGHWALNYGPLTVHRRANWMVSVKGHSRYLWAFERSLTDARLDQRRQNVLGFHDSSAAISIHLRGNPVNAVESGYAGDGWDWCRIPGSTTRLIPADELLELDRKATGKPMNRPFGNSTFVGGVSLDQRHGVFAMQHREVAPDRPREGLRSLKALFFFDDQIVVITRGINNGDGEYPVGTTLFQCRLPSAQSPTWVQDREVAGVDDRQRFDDEKPLTLVDPVGNGYYIPRAENVVVRRARQTSLDYTGTRQTRGDFATAWFDHGVSPEHDQCHFVILVNAGRQKLARFAKEAKQTYSVNQQNSRAVIVEQRQLGLTGYVLPQSEFEIEKGLIARVSDPCLAMTRMLDETGLTLSVCNPDLGWERGRQFEFRSKDGYQPPVEPVPMPVTLTLRGTWKLARKNPEVEVVAVQNETTTLRVSTSDSRSIEFEIRKDQ